VRPDRLIGEIIEDPRRPLVWKVADVTVLTVLWIGLVVTTVLALGDINFAPLWYFWILATSIASARAWYTHPRRRNRRSPSL
jgi:hypothetical protein